MKKFLISALILMMFFISGCSKKNLKENSVLTFSSWGSQSEIVVLKKLINDFEKENPDINVKLIHIPQNYFQKLHLLFASNMAPDVVFVNNIYAPIYIKSGLLEDVSPYFSDEINNDIYFNNAIKSFSYENKIYAVPRDLSNLVIYYNKDIFDKEGVTYPKSNWTLNDLLYTAEKVNGKNCFGINFEEKSLYWLYYLESNGGGILSDDAKHIILDSPQSIEALQFYSDLINKYKVAPTKTQIASMTTAQIFINGKLAMYLGGRWMVPKFRESIPFNWDVINFPASEKNKVLVDSSGWAISKSSKNKQNAIKLIKFLSSEKSIEEFTKSGLIIPARIDVAKSETFLSTNQKPKNSKAFIDMIKNAKPTPTNEHYQQINDILDESLEPVFNGDKKASQVISPKLIKKINELL